MSKLKEIRLYGFLRAKFGASFMLSVESPAEAVRALSSQLEGFKESLTSYEPGFRIKIENSCLSEDDMCFSTSADIIRIVPCLVGAGGGSGWGTILAGIAIVAIAWGTAGFGLTMAAAAKSSFLVGFAMNMGMAMAIGGVSRVLAGTPHASSVGLDKGPADEPTHVFSAPHLSIGQGYPVPVGYGKLRIGGAIVSLGVCSENWTTNGIGALAPDETGTNFSGDGRTAPLVAAIAPA